MSFDCWVDQGVGHGGEALSCALTIPVCKASVNLEEIGDDRSLVLKGVHEDKVSAGGMCHDVVVGLKASVDLTVEIEATI